MSVYFEDWFVEWYSTLSRTEQSIVDDIAFDLGFVDENGMFDPDLLTYEELDMIYETYDNCYW